MNVKENGVLKSIISECKLTYEGKPLVYDIGDILPFLYYFGEHDFCDKQIEMTVEIIEKKWLYQKDSNKLKIVDQIDMLLGFIELYRLSQKDKHLFYARRIFESINTYFLRNGIVCYTEIPKNDIRPVYLSLYGAMVIELAVDLYDFTNDDFYINKAEEISDIIINDKFFIKNGFFCSGYYFKGFSLKEFYLPFLKHKWRIKTTKSSNFISGLISLYEKTHNENIEKAIDRYFNSIEIKLYNNDFFYSTAYIENQKLNSQQLFGTFLTIDRLCHAFFVFKKEKYIRFAKKIADSWLKKQGKTGLFPYNYDGNISWLDSCTDFSVSLLRLFELTKEEKYKHAADDCYQGILEFNWPYESVDIHNGEKMKPLLHSSPDSQDEYRSDPKFKALFLKLMIYYNSDKKIFEENGLFKLLRDR